MKITKSKLQQILKEYTTNQNTTCQKDRPRKDSPAGFTGVNKRKVVFEITQNKIFEKLVNGKPVRRR